jgi:hypothetical protein
VQGQQLDMRDYERNGVHLHGIEQNTAQMLVVGADILYKMVNLGSN